MKNINVTVYTFSELSPKAQEKARDWWREASAGETHFAESVIEDAQTCAAILGIEFAEQNYQTVGGKTLQEPAVSWAVDSRDAGVAFKSRYHFVADSPAKIRAHAPQDAALHAIADTLQAVQVATGFTLTATTTVNRDNRLEVETYTDGETDATEDQIESVTDALRDFAGWMLAQLTAAYDYDQSNESIDEMLEANEYEFTAAGKRFVV